MARTHETLKSLFDDTAAAIRSKTGKTDKIVADNFPTEISSIVLGSGDATDADVRLGKTYSNDNGASTGTMPEKSAETYTPTTVDQIISKDVYLSGDQTVKGDENLIADNIAKNITIFGVVGTFEGEKHIIIPSITTNSFDYDGTEKDPELTYDSKNVNISGTQKATNAGTYTITCSLKNSEIEWTDGTTADKILTWSIERVSAGDKPSTIINKEYNGETQTNDYTTPNGISMTGNNSGIEAGTYTAIYTPDSNHTWSNGDTSSVTVVLTISKINLTIPSLTDTSKIYNGEEQNPTINNYNSSYENQTGMISASAAGSYTIIWSIKDTINYQWTDGTITNKNGNWSIAILSLTIPTLSNTDKTYSGSNQSPTINNYNATYESQNGTTSSTNVGTYTITWALKDTINCKWSDNTTTNKSSSWTISRLSVGNKPTTSVSKQYNGSVQTNGYTAPSGVTMTGDNSGTNVGSYTAVYIPDSNHMWSNGDTGEVSVILTITKVSLTIPSLNNTSKSYTGSAQSPTISNYNSTYENQSGTSSATNAGSYTITWSLKDTTNYQWSDGTIANKTGNWTISKISGSISLDKTSISFDSSTKSSTITVTRSGDGTISASSSNTSVAVTSASSNVITVSAPGETAGDATITINVAEGTNYLAMSATCSVSATYFPMPTKGQIITMDLGTTAAAGTNNQYRVLKVNGTQAEVVAMFDYNTSTVFNSSSVTTTIGSLTCQKYSGSNLDNVLNSTVYGAMNDAAKAAIVAQDIKQDAWYWGTSGNPVYSGYYGTSNPGTSSYSISLYSNSGTAYTEDCGNRYVYALSVQDVIDYVTDTTVGDGQLQNYNIWNMFWNTTSQPSNYTYPLLRSASAGYSDGVWYVNGYGGSVVRSRYSSGCAVRPAFTIDLSKISWS